MDIILSVEEAGFAYTPGKFIFEEVSFSVAKGEVLSILGPNGTGKSTLMKCLVNIMPAEKGKISLQGHEITSLSADAIARDMGYVPQSHTVVFPFTVRDFVVMGRAPHLSLFGSPGKEDFAIVEGALEKVGIASLVDRPVSEISGGEQQMVMIARALAQEPDILLLDEPTSHLDFGNQLRVLKIIDELASDGLSVVMSTHFPDHGFLISDSVAVMKDGGLLAYGAAEEVITPETLRRTYGVDVDVHYVEAAGRYVCVPLAEMGERRGRCQCGGRR